MATIHVEVTQEDIASGVTFDCSKCPIARASTRALRIAGVPAEIDAAYLGITVRATRDLRKHTISTPTRVSRWMRDFDLGKPVQPFAFDLEIPDEVLQ